MDKVTQQNAANCEESASAAEEMSSQAEELQSMIAQFNLTATSGKSERQVRAAHQVKAAHTSSGKEKAAHAESLRSRKSGNGKVDPEELIPMKSEVLREF